MAQSGYTSLALYHSITPTTQPVNTDLVAGELAINITDGKLYYKDNLNVVKLLASNGTSAPVTSINFGSTGLTPSTATSGAVTVAGTLAIGNGGTGATTLAGANIAVFNVPNTFTALQTFSGSATAASLKTSNIKEVVTVSATAATGTIDFDILTQSVLYYTTAASGNWTVNFRGSVTATLDSIMSVGESLSATSLITQGATAYYNSSVQVDGTTSGVTTVWQGSAPTSGNVSSLDSYTFAIIKTASATFTVLATQTKFI
jgi:hypothetical protein